MAIHETVDKADGVVFRCTLSGSAADRWLEVPAWMFDRARCLDPSRLTASPFVSMDALSVLSDLLRQALKPPLSSSNAPHSGASRSSDDQNRGEAHDHAKPGTTASDAGRTAKASAKRPFPADRPVRRRNPTQTPAWRSRAVTANHAARTTHARGAITRGGPIIRDLLRRDATPKLTCAGPRSCQ